MTAVESSYRPDAMAGGVEGERSRLEWQADLTWDLELSTWRAAGLPDDGVVLDLGCGSGAVTERLRTSLPSATVIGADPDPVLLSGVEPPVVRIVDGRVDLPDSTVDAVIVRYVMQHLDSARRIRLLREARRVLAPGGRIHIVDVLDAEWGEVRPVMPTLRPLYERIAAHQAAAGGDRSVIELLPRELALAGFGAIHTTRASVSSADRDLDDFAVHLGPQRYLSLVADGVISSLDLAHIAWAWHVVSSSPDAYVSLAIHVVTAVRQNANPSEGLHP